jgi:CBS domain-containing protein
LVVSVIELTERQEKILEIVKDNGPITGDRIAEMLDVTRAALRPDLAVLTMSGFLDAKPRVGYTYKSESVPNSVTRLLEQYRVGDFKSIPIMVADSCSIYDAIVTLFTADIGTLFVVDKEGLLVGVVSRKDFLKTALGQGDVRNVPVSVIMTRMPNVILTTPDESIIIAARKIVEHEVDCLPVVRTFVQHDEEEKYEVVGRFSKTNIARFMLDLAQRSQRLTMVQKSLPKEG